jgi:1-phosphofructokinase/tagatose 6-phosphate kinase
VILTVTLNVALDRTVAVPRMALGNRHRVVDTRRAAGGKGVHIARALKCLGEPVIATGFAAGPTGARIRELLDAEQVLHDFVEVAGDSRTNLSVVDPTSGEQTEINERGPQVTAADLERFKERLLYLAGGAEICVIAGSLPPSAEADHYADLIADLRSVGVPTLLDTDGEPMRVGLRAQPAVVVPNVGEAEEAVGYEFTEPEDLNTALADLVGMGAEEAIVTTASGCVALVGEGHAKHLFEASIEPLATVASVGSGDAFLAGFVTARRAERSIEDCLAYGVACGAESTQHLGAGSLSSSEAAKLVGRVSVNRLNAPLRAA